MCVIFESDDNADDSNLVVMFDGDYRYVIAVIIMITVIIAMIIMVTMMVLMMWMVAVSQTLA